MKTIKQIMQYCQDEIYKHEAIRDDMLENGADLVEDYGEEEGAIFTLYKLLGRIRKSNPQIRLKNERRK